jgi:diacylglycerol kinase family enzyme
MNLDKALNLVVTKPAVRFIDAMEVNGKFYLLNLTVGFTPLAMEMTDREQKRKLGRMAYFLAGFRSLFGVQPIFFFLSIDNAEMDFKASEMILMNSVTIGDPGRYLNLGIENDDGILDLFIIKSRTIRDYFRVILNLILRNPDQDPDVERFRVKEKLRISGKKLLQVQADGDLIGYTPVEVNLVQSAVGIIVPE